MKRSKYSPTAPSNSEPIEQFFSGCRGRFDLDLEKRLAELSQSVTLIWGENAVDPPLESGYRLEPVAKQSSLVVLPNLGVLAALESPMQVS